MPVDLTPYATAKPMMDTLPTWVGADDALRIGAYQLYQSMYENVPDAFKIVQRGSDANPIYIPNARTIIEATNRYLAKRWNFALDPRLGTDADRAALNVMMLNMFRREEMYAKFGTQKRYGLIRGDQVWHITADENKAPGKRISVYEIDPASYFPITDDSDQDKLIGCHLVDQFDAGQGKMVLRRQTYRKTDTGAITYEQTWWETGGWDDRTGSGQTLKRAATPAGQEAIPAYELPAEITSIPVYHIKNNRVPGDPFGRSELQGLERIMAAVNQAISDEELSLALEGLGLYATTSGPPVDDAGNETTWKIGPGWVVEIDQDAEFKRVTGVSTVAPVQQHVSYLEGAMREAAGVPDIAIGSVDVTTAESGIALAFKMSPLLAKNEEKESELLAVMDHFLYDLSTMWFPAYEGLVGNPAQAVSVVDDPMPVDRAAVLNEVISMLTCDPPIISVAYAQQILSEKLGYDFPEEMLQAIVAEQAALAAARNVDPFTSRMAQELNDNAQQ